MPSTVLTTSAQADGSAEPALEDEVLYQSNRTFVSRRRLPDGSSVILKKALGADAVRRLCREREILKQTASIDGIARLAPGVWEDDVLALQDNSGAPLTTFIENQALALDTTLRLALSLSRTLAKLHGRGVVHKDLNPSNILWCEAQGGHPVLIDFNIAASSADEQAAFAADHNIAGTMAYMPPEQTGRTSQPVDHRSDLYALGMVLYRLVAGRHPFETDDLLDLLHMQLTVAPPPLSALMPATPPTLSAIVQRLLEKEPARRYQSAFGLAHDLERLIHARSSNDAAAFDLGTRDFAARLMPPPRMIGRGAETALLESALGRIARRGACVFVSGPAGIGKTALVGGLRSVLADSKGWFVSGKFDPHRPDGPSATVQALRHLGSLLLSEPEESLARHRSRLVEALGSNITAGIAQLPEFNLLLGAQPRPSGEDPAEAERRMLQATIDVLGSVASPMRPLVVLLDDLQWAPELSIRFIDALIAALPGLPGLLVVMAYRPDEVLGDSTLKQRLPRWEKLNSVFVHLALDALSDGAVNEIVGDMLRLPPREAKRLGHALGERAQGNPQDLIELINALRLDGLLELAGDGWHWEERALQRYVGESIGVDFLARRIAKLPPPCLSLMETLACLGGSVSVALLDASRDPSLADALQALVPAFEDGLVVNEVTPRGSLLSFRNNRVQECVHAVLRESGRKAEVQLAHARRLAAHPAYERQAAQQYLEVVDRIDTPDERRGAATLLRAAAVNVHLTNYAVCEKLSAAGIQLLDAIATEEDSPLLLSLLKQQHLSLYARGRHAQADAVYERITSRTDDPFLVAGPTGEQIVSLTNRGRHAEAFTLGMRVLAQLGLAKPDDVSTTLKLGLAELSAWVHGPDKAADLHRPEATDKRVLTLMVLLKRVLIAAYEADRLAYSWLVIESCRLWKQHGPCEALLNSVASFSLLLSSSFGDRRGAQALARHAIEVGTARGYEPGTSTALVMAALYVTHWSEPLEAGLAQVERARKELAKGNNIPVTTFCHGAATMAHFESARTLGEAVRENTAQLAFDASTGNSVIGSVSISFRQLMRAMRGETSAPGAFDDAQFDEGAAASASASIPGVLGMLYASRVLAAGIFNDHQTVLRYNASAKQWMPALSGLYIVSLVHLCFGLALAEKSRTCPTQDREAVLEEMTTHRDWLAERSIDAPTNFLHLAHLLDAERAWTLGDIRGAATAFENTMAEADQRKRPWHRALIHERAARFQLAHGWERTGRPLLAEATNGFDEWGAVGKVNALIAEFPFLGGMKARQGNLVSESSGTIVSSHLVDTMAILRASQALSSETSLSKLNARVVKVLGAICGAETVLMLVHPHETTGWFLATTLAQDAVPMSIEQVAADGQLALSAFRYAERTREPLLLEDATRDHRFSGDPALMGVAHCSLLLVPILKQGELQAMLVLENRLRQGAFSADRLDAVKLIAGQLAVSLDNALLYAALERKVAERTAALAEANQRLELLSITDALTGLANRRHFDATLESEWSRAMRVDAPVGLAMIDIDQFKQYNDHYGHHGGDVCLKLVAEAMKNELRAGSDLIARYGGEEFVLLLRDSDLEATRVVAERVRAAVARRAEPHVRSTHGVVTISVGIASCIPRQGTSPARCLEDADAALYRAKQSGRNRVA